MNESDLLERIAVLAGQAGLIAVPTVVIVEAIRKRVPFDGWKVLLVAGIVCLVLTALLLSPATLHDVYNAGAVAVLAWASAVGGDSWVSKIARKAKSVTIVPTVGLNSGGGSGNKGGGETK